MNSNYLVWRAKCPKLAWYLNHLSSFVLPSPFARVRCHSPRLYRMSDRLVTQAALIFSLGLADHGVLNAKKVRY